MKGPLRGLGDLSLRVKLALLAGVPVLGAILLGLLIAGEVRTKTEKARALGSVESVAELSAVMGGVLSALALERAQVALWQGQRERATATGGDAPPRSQLDDPIRATDGAVVALEGFLQARDASRIEGRLAERLGAARRALAGLPQLRRDATEQGRTLEQSMTAYGAAARELIGATAALTELTDDGELLRPMTALVAVLELEERGVREHALLAYVFAADAFPPGGYRTLVTLLTEADTHAEVLRTNATGDQARTFDRALGAPSAQQALALRQRALDADDEAIGVEPQKWFSTQAAKLEAMRSVERELQTRVRLVAGQKQRETTAAARLGAGLVIVVVLSSAALATLIARGLQRSVASLMSATQRLAHGDLAVRAGVVARDELGALGRAFDEMAGELVRSREALSESARASRELEIASNLQQALLPGATEHPDYEFAGRIVPADEVGGDFYDVLVSPKSEELWITVGDVSSHGLGSGLVMMMTQIAFQSHFRIDPRAEPGAVLRGVNELLCEAVGQRLKDDKYVTAQLFSVGPRGELRYAGGHQSVVVHRAATGAIEVTEAPGPWLGIVRDLPDFPVRALQLGAGDTLCLYSDGITEARSADGELYDLSRLEAALARALAGTPTLDAAVAAVFEDVGQHSASRDDDWTLFLVRRRSGAALEVVA